YKDLAAYDARVDAGAAREMISLYRRNNGLGPVALDPSLEAAAKNQALSMAQANKLSHEVRGNFTARLDSAGFTKNAAVENVSAARLRAGALACGIAAGLAGTGLCHRAVDREQADHAGERDCVNRFHFRPLLCVSRHENEPSAALVQDAKRSRDIAKRS